MAYDVQGQNNIVGIVSFLHKNDKRAVFLSCYS